MSEAVVKAKKGFWRYFGATMMEQKDGVQAVSFTRSLAIVLFIQAMWIWSGMSEQTEVAQSMLHTLWGLIGIKGAKDVAGAFKK